MWSTFWLAAFTSIVLSLLFNIVTDDQRPQNVSVRVMAPSLLEHHHAAIDYARAYPIFTGSISTANLSFPAWYRSPGFWQSLVSSSGVVVTYSAIDFPPGRMGAFIDALIQTSAGSVGVGRSWGGYVQSVAGSIMPLPSEVPDGVAVAATKIR
jgi:hypothetical protein